MFDNLSFSDTKSGFPEAYHEPYDRNAESKKANGLSQFVELEKTLGVSPEIVGVKE